MIIISSQGYIRSIVNIVRLDNTNLIITILLRKIKVLGRKKCIYMNHELASVFVKIFFQGNTFIKHVWLNTSYYNNREHFISTGYYEINTIKYHDHEQ